MAVSLTIVGRLVSMMFVGISPLANPRQIVLVRAGVSIAGAAIGAAAIFVYLACKSLIETADAIGPAVVAGLAGWHAGCLATDSCLGTVSDRPMGPGNCWQHGDHASRGALRNGAIQCRVTGLASWKQQRRSPLRAVTGFTIASLGGVRLVTESMQIFPSGGSLWSICSPRDPSRHCQCVNRAGPHCSFTLLTSPFLFRHWSQFGLANQLKDAASPI